MCIPSDVNGTNAVSNTEEHDVFQQEQDRQLSNPGYELTSSGNFRKPCAVIK